MNTIVNHNQNKLQPVRLALLAALTLVTLVAFSMPSAAADSKGTIKPEITVANLAGSWQVAINTNAGCGAGVHLLVFTLNSQGSATDVNDTYNTTECGQGSIPDQTFTITSLNSDGTGTATYSNAGDTLTLSIQVSGNKQVFNLADTANSGQYWAGTAIKQ
jgi:hypothetical protein